MTRVLGFGWDKRPSWVLLIWNGEEPCRIFESLTENDKAVIELERGER